MRTRILVPSGDRPFESMKPKFLLPLALLGLTACSSTKELDVQTSDRWVAPSPVLEEQLQSEAERLPWTRDIERLELIRWFAGVGEPAYPTLLELVTDERDEVSAAALSAIGATGDRRLVPHVQDLEWNASERSFDVRLERARTLLRLGDWSEVPTLIEGLEDERLLTRALSVQALREATRQEFAFDPRGEDTARELAVARWERWWMSYSGDPLRSED